MAGASCTTGFPTHSSIYKECYILKKFKNIIAAALCVSVMSGCFGSPEQPAGTSQTTTAATQKQTETSAPASETTEATGSAAVLASEDEPDIQKKDRPLVVAVDGIDSGYSPFDPASAFTDAAGKMTGVTLIGRTRSGARVLTGNMPMNERYNDKVYTYSGAADTAVTRNEAEDTTTYSFMLRRDIKFADGETLDADDVIFTLYMHLDPSYTGAYPLSDTGIVGSLNYRYNSSAADTITPDKVGEILDTDDMKQVIREQVMIPALKEQFATIKTFYDDSAYSVYTSRYPRPEELFAFFYSINGKYSAKGKTESEVISDIADMYDGNYRQLASVIVGDEHAFDDKVQNLAVDRIAETNSANSDDEHVYNVSGIVKNGQFSVAVTVSGDGSAFEQAMEHIVIAPLHYYGIESLYNYNNNMFGFIKGKASEYAEKHRDDPLCAGAYDITGFADGEVLLKANEFYYKGEVGSAEAKIVNGKPAEAAQLIADGIADICLSDGSAESYAAAEEANRSIEKVYLASSADLGYGYIGINVTNVSVGDGFSDKSYALRMGIATAIRYFRAESLSEYFGSASAMIEYPYVERVEMDKSADGYIIPYMRDADGAPIFTPEMTETDMREALKNACLGFFRKAGYTVSADGKITDAPYNGKLEFNVLIAAGGKGDHPSYKALADTAELLGELGLTLIITDTDDPAVIWGAVSDKTNEIWAGAWDREDISTVYIDSYYGLEGSTKLKRLIADASAAPESDKPAAFMKCYDKILNTYAAEIPMYRRSTCTMFSALRIDTSTIPEDMSDSYDWLDAIADIRPKR